MTPALPSDEGSRKREAFGSHFLFRAAAVVVIVAGLRAASGFILPLLFATLLTLLSWPVFRWLTTRRVPEPVALAATLFGALLALALFLFVATAAVNEFATSAPQYLDQVQFRLASLFDRLRSAEGFGEWLGAATLDPGEFVDLAASTAGGLLTGTASLLSFLLLVFLTMAFMLAESNRFGPKLRAALGILPYSEGQVTYIVGELQRFVAIKTVVSAITGALVAGWVAALGLEFPLFWGLAAFLLNFIPTLGSIIAAIPAAVLAWLQFGLGRALLVLVGYLVINLVLGNVVEPRWMGRRFGLSTLVVFLSLLFWGWVWGPLGMLLSVPLTRMAKIVLEQTPSLRWVAILLGPSTLSTSAVISGEETSRSSASPTGSSH